MRAKVTSALFSVCAALSIAWLIRSFPPGERPTILVAGALALTVAAAGVFFAPRFSYCAVVLSGFVILYWFSRFELSNFPAINSWIAFNLPDSDPQFRLDIFQAKLKILLVVAVVISTLVSVTRLLPDRCVLRGRPLRERTWPAFAFCLLAIGPWYYRSVNPYRIPLLVKGSWNPELVILHVEKRGLTFHERSVGVVRDSSFHVESNARKLFQYKFFVLRGSGVVPETSMAGIRMFAQSAQLRDLRTPPAVSLRDWNAEGWYVRTGQNVLAFTTENHTTPPQEVIDMFHRLESIPPAATESGNVSDVCLGFCYDPLAGLWVVYMTDPLRRAE